MTHVQRLGFFFLFNFQHYRTQSSYPSSVKACLDCAVDFLEYFFEILATFEFLLRILGQVEHRFVFKNIFQQSGNFDITVKLTNWNTKRYTFEISLGVAGV